MSQHWSWQPQISKGNSCGSASSVVANFFSSPKSVYFITVILGKEKGHLFQVYLLIYHEMDCWIDRGFYYSFKPTIGSESDKQAQTSPRDKRFIYSSLPSLSLERERSESTIKKIVCTVIKFESRVSFPLRNSSLSSAEPPLLNVRSYSLQFFQPKKK